MIITNQKSKCCGAALRAKISNEGTRYHICTKCNESTDAYVCEQLPDNIMDYWRDIPCTTIRVNNNYEKVHWLKKRISEYEQRITELENEVANLRAGRV